MEHDVHCRGRGVGAKFKWVRPQIKKLSGRAKTSIEARAWFWLGDRLGELAKLVEKPVSGRWEHRCGLVRKIQEWMPPTGQLDVKGLWLARLSMVQGACASILMEWRSLAHGLAEAESAGWVARRRRERRAWVVQACAGSGRLAHRVTKLPIGWRPDPVGAEGRPRSRQERVDDLAEVWRSSIWEPNACEATDQDFADFTDTELYTPTVKEVRAAAKSLPEYIGLGVDA